MFIIFILIQYLNGQPCTAPVTLISSQKTGVCTPPVSAAQLLAYNYATLGTNTNGAQQFSVAFWFQPPSAPLLGGATYGILRVSTDTSDITPSTTNGIRLAVYFSLDSTNKGFYLVYSETPSSPSIQTDITQMASAYSGGWMFIYAGLDYTSGYMKISTWETKFTFWQQKTFQASKVNFNAALDTNTAIEVFYWGIQNSFCGNINNLYWMPKYYELVDDNIFTLPYFLAGKVNADMYIYRFDTIGKGSVVNAASSGTVTLQQNMQATYYEMDLTHNVLVLPTNKWTAVTSSYTFQAIILQTQLPQFGADIILFQRYTASNANLLCIKLAKQASGQMGILLTLQSSAKLLLSFDCLVDEWYNIQISIAFPNSITGQVNTLVKYHVISPDGTLSSGYQHMSYTGNIATAFDGTDKVNIGDSVNPYTDKLQIRFLRFDEGFQTFKNSQCTTGCTVGFYSLTASENKCYYCDLSSKFDSTFQCTTSLCSANYYEITDMTSQNFCAFCDSSQSYYVNPSQICIKAACGNGYKEPPAEDCDDNGTSNNDGCDSTCKFEVGYNCAPATDYILTTCIIYCGNGVRDEVTSPVALAYTEECDDHNTVANDGCTNCSVDHDLWECTYSFPTTCTKLCGNGKLDNDATYSQTEQCDDGNTSNSDGCSSTCTVEAAYMCSAVPLQLSVCILICGNGALNAGEQCDDGNVDPNDGCTNCTIDSGWDCSGTICTQYCGNGTKDVIPAKSINEQCDDGNSLQYDGCYNCLVEVGWTCDASNPTKCHKCGNGKREPYELCDDGNLNNSDGCNSTCQIEASWTCNGDQPDQCKNCGDGKKQQIEDCDDGNSISNDGCTNCLIDQYFQCSGGSPTSADVCTRTCPNGIVTGNEECDDNNNVTSDGCNLCVITMGYVCNNAVQPSVCSVDVCGNGQSHSVNEECDDGNLVAGDGCNSTCKIEVGWQCEKSKCTPICGDSKKVQNVEECDDGNLIDGDGCNSTCKVELSYSCTGGDLTKKDTCIVVCGNNVRDDKEQCDDGNTRNGDGCSSLCLIETSFGCAQVTMQDNSVRDECFNCIDNCAVCTDSNIEGCTLCYQGYYKSTTSCTQSCDDGYYPDPILQACLACSKDCVKCYNNSQCYRCLSPLLLDGTACVQKCKDGYYIKQHELKGQWCKKCPTHCTICTSETLCTSCDDYYSPQNTCKYCDMGELCLGCDFETNTCKKCKLGYRPYQDGCLVIDEKCGDGLVSLNEKCDDGNLANDDGCSRSCTIEENANCRLISNEGPSECFDTLGWEFSLDSYILDPELILLTFSNPIKYDDALIKNISVLFTLSINGFESTDYTYEFQNNSNSNESIYIRFAFLKNVVSQTLTVTLNDQTKLKNYYDVKINPDKITQTVDLEDKEFYTDQQISFFTLLRNIAYGLQILNWILVIAAGFLDQEYRIWKTIEMLQVICALYYINLRSYPLNSEMLLTDLRYSNLYILPNFLQQHTDEYLQSLRRFSMAGLTYQVINNTGGLFLFYLGISLIVYAFTKLVYHKLVISVFEVFLDKLEFSYFFKFYEIFLLELLISCLHNVKHNSMSSNWNGTNTVIALLLLLFIILIQVTQFLIAFFRDHFGTAKEIQILFGSLTDGCHDHDRKRRVFMSQQDFIKKFFVAYAMIYVEEPFQQMLFIVVPRALMSFISCFIMKNWFLRVKEILSELLLYGIIGMVYQLALGNFVGDLDTKVFYGQLWVYLVMGQEALHGFCNIYLVWKLLQVLENTLPEEKDPMAGVNKKIDLFKQRGLKAKLGKTQKELQEDADRKARLAEAKRKKKLEQEQALKNANREKWNVWNMQKEAAPEERKFVSVNHNEYGDQLVPAPQVPKLILNPSDELINFDELDQLDQFFGQPGNTQILSQSQFQPNATNTASQFLPNQTNNKSGLRFQPDQTVNKSGFQPNQTVNKSGFQPNQTVNKSSQQQIQLNNQTINKSSQQIQLNQTLNKTTQQFQPNQTLNRSVQQPNQTLNESGVQGIAKLDQQWSGVDQTLMQDQQKSAIQQPQKAQASTFQFEQQKEQKVKKVNESQDESLGNENPFEF